jgi:hypothetical protein
VGLDGAEADRQLILDLAGGPPSSGSEQDVLLASGQRLGGLVWASPDVVRS